MSLLDNLKTHDDVEDEKDIIRGFTPLPTDIYPLKIDMAYMIKSARGATGLTLHARTPDDRQVRQTIYLTSSEAKGCKNTYIDKNGNPQYLPGFILGNSLALLTTGKEIGAMDLEDKMVKIYNPATSSEEPTSVPVLVELLDKEVYAAIQEVIEDKRKKGDDGDYHATGETRQTNEIAKFFRASDKKTTAEIRAKAETAEYFDTWKEQNQGQVRDKTTSTSGKSSSGAGSPFGGNSAPANKPQKSLFA